MPLQIQLVITIDIIQKVENQNHRRQKLKSVIWTHWEMDPEYPQMIEGNGAYELNKLFPERNRKVIQDTETIQPAPDAYRVVVSFDRHPYWVRAWKSNTYKVSTPVIS
jgi:hypothetical protein